MKPTTPQTRRVSELGPNMTPEGLYDSPSSAGSGCESATGERPTHTHAQTFTQTHIKTHTHRHTLSYTNTHTRIKAHTHLYTHINTFTHMTCAHTHIHTLYCRQTLPAHYHSGCSPYRRRHTHRNVGIAHILPEQRERGHRLRALLAPTHHTHTAHPEHPAQPEQPEHNFDP